MVALIGLNTSNVADSASRIANVALVRACQASNEFRAADLKRWKGIEKFILASSPSTDVRTQQFVTYIDEQNQQADRQRNCTSTHIAAN